MPGSHRPARRVLHIDPHPATGFIPARPKCRQYPPMRTPRYHSALLAAAAAAIAFGSCTGLEPTVLSAGASVAETGASVFARGKSQVFELATFDLSVEAVRKTAAALSLEQTAVREYSGRMRLRYRDERGQYLTVLIERRTETVTRIFTDVGSFGRKGLAALFFAQLRRELVDELGVEPL